jgi:hypothetical protein
MAFSGRLYNGFHLRKITFQYASKITSYSTFDHLHLSSSIYVLIFRIISGTFVSKIRDLELQETSRLSSLTKIWRELAVNGMASSSTTRKTFKYATKITSYSKFYLLHVLIRIDDVIFRNFLHFYIENTRFWDTKYVLTRVSYDNPLFTSRCHGDGDTCRGIRCFYSVRSVLHLFKYIEK